ncbi:hypothetical protein M011DRAFT_479293 [Sporormia fimetaria CBS 119925]|uniref:UBA domain-containing protein n=1 Tax=Sporormia fimetaria CBS 119925 TaxID=1340428 RepID=A0A6A6V500_9PLEO|nr:hypothetical protein M011DRAFT_479293 [Sporormia fimetaria CBS 119925]
MRVIQDSDEEGEEIEADPNDGLHVSNTPCAAGTNSAEALRWAFQAAHRDHFQTQTDNSGSEKSAMRPPAVLLSQGHGSASTRPHLPLGSPLSVTKSETPPASHDERQKGKDWELPATIHQDYTDHEPMALFPEPSSTVSNTTLTQERLLREVMAPEFLGLESDHGLDTAALQPQYEIQKSSIPWSDYIKTPSEHQGSNSVPQSTGVLNLPEPSPKPAPDTFARRITSPMKDSLPVDERRSTDLPVHPRKKRKITPEVIADDNLEGITVEMYKPRPSRSRSSGTPLTQPLDYSVKPEKSGRKPARRSKTTGEIKSPQRLATPDKVQEIKAMGFTPIRSRRALELNNGDITQSVDWLLSHAFSEEKDELAPPSPPMPTEKKKPKKPGRPKVIPVAQPAVPPQGDGEAFLEIATSPGVADSNSRAGSKGQSGLEDTNAMIQTSPAGVAVVIPRLDAKDAMSESGIRATSPSTHHAGASPEVTYDPTTINKSLRNDEGAAKEEGRIQPTPKPPRNQKRGRGRPKTGKAAQTPVEQPEALRSDVCEIQTKQVEPLKSDEKLTDLEQERHHAPASIADAPAADLANAEQPMVNEQRNTPDRQMQTAKGIASPLSKGKVPYRVGLSKRARIAPLLRVVRK